MSRLEINQSRPIRASVRLDASTAALQATASGRGSRGDAPVEFVAVRARCFAPGEFCDTPPLGGRCRARQALLVYPLNRSELRDAERSVAL
jgi:hypothetical protein